MNIQLKSSLLLTNIIENYDNAITIYDRKKKKKKKNNFN